MVDSDQVLRREIKLHNLGKGSTIYIRGPEITYKEGDIFTRT